MKWCVLGSQFVFSTCLPERDVIVWGRSFQRLAFEFAFGFWLELVGLTFHLLIDHFLLLLRSRYFEIPLNCH